MLQGPVGLPLENADNTRKFRDLKMGFLLPDGGLNATSKTASAVISDQQKNKDQEWKAPVRYIGVDVQYFAALVVPVDDQLKDPTIERSVPMVLDRPANQSHTDLSIQLDSKPIVLPPQQAVTQHFELFAGPKRKVLLEPLQAEGILDSSWFSPPIVSHAMLGLLNFFHGLGLPYGLAIICLTICVRACMFPLSLRQTAQAHRMKEMQPRIEELKKKHAGDKEKFAMAQMQLWREHKINPMSGCLPLFVQLPIFTGLWMALNSSVDLRRAPFLYFHNLAAPDALFHLPFVVPFLGWTDFNLLPFIHGCAVRRAAEDVHASADRRPAANAVQDDERDDDRDGRHVLSRSCRPVRLLHLLEPVGDRRAETARILEKKTPPAGGQAGAAVG